LLLNNTATNHATAINLTTTAKNQLLPHWSKELLMNTKLKVLLTETNTPTNTPTTWNTNIDIKRDKTRTLKLTFHNKLKNTKLPVKPTFHLKLLPTKPTAKPTELNTNTITNNNKFVLE
jgi:hypothetical protein